MKFVYKNRRGHNYYLKSGLTPKGNKKYYLFKQMTADDLETVPDGYEVFENVHGGVFIRKLRPSILLPSEMGVLEKKVATYQKEVRYEEKGKSIILYHITNSGLFREESFAALAFRSGVLDIDKFGDYMQMFCFELMDPTERLFAPYRWCTRSAKEYWLNIGSPNSLKKLIEKYLHHINQDSFYELH